jgi:hypothetical protein
MHQKRQTKENSKISNPNPQTAKEANFKKLMRKYERTLANLVDADIP